MPFCRGDLLERLDELASQPGQDIGDHFDTAGAMHAADEMIWFHSDEINGFPTVALP